MEIVIVRQEPKPWGIDGRLSIGRQYLCDTVEHPTRHLPEGDYQITNDKSQMTNEECFIPSPFRHGDGALASLHGEIIVGKQLLPGVVSQSQATYNLLYERLKKAFQRGSHIHLRIVN